jgi:hypothetical protein
MKRSNDVKEALEHGAACIDQLRRENELLGIKAQAFDAMAGLITLLVPHRPQGVGIDAAWVMRRLLADIKDDENVVNKEDPVQ